MRPSRTSDADALRGFKFRTYSKYIFFWIVIVAGYLFPLLHSAMPSIVTPKGVALLWVTSLVFTIVLVTKDFDSTQSALIFFIGVAIYFVLLWFFGPTIFGRLIDMLPNVEVGKTFLHLISNALLSIMPFEYLAAILLNTYKPNGEILQNDRFITSGHNYPLKSDKPPKREVPDLLEWLFFGFAPIYVYDSVKEQYVPLGIVAHAKKVERNLRIMARAEDVEIEEDVDLPEEREETPRPPRRHKKT